MHFMTVVLYLNGGSFVESLRQITDFQRDFLRTVLWRTYMQLWLVAILIFPVSIVSIDWLHLALSFLGTRGREVKLLCVVCLCVGLGVGGTGALILGLIGRASPGHGSRSSSSYQHTLPLEHKALGGGCARRCADFGSALC